MTTFIGHSIFWLVIASGVIFVYQAAILPSIRLKLRYRLFCLRDALRTLAMNGTIKETSPAFLRLHDNLNTLSTSLSRVDLGRAALALSHMDEESRSRAAAHVDLMKNAPLEVTKIYEDSVHVFMAAMICNSLFVVLFFGFWVLWGTLLQVGIRHLREAFWKKIGRDTELAFFSPDTAVV